MNHLTFTQEAIDATHPALHDDPLFLIADEHAMELVGYRHAKRDLVNLVRFLLVCAHQRGAEAQSLRLELDEQIKRNTELIRQMNRV